MAIHLDDGSWSVQGHRLDLPVRIRDATAAVATYVVRAERARTLVEGTGLDLVGVAGRTPLFLALVRYRASDLGTYDEVGMALLARHRGCVGPYVHQLPVTQDFTLEAGRALWGLPKWRARAELSVAGRDATCHLADEQGRHVLTAALRTSALRLPLPLRGRLTALAPAAGTVLADGVRARLAGVRLGRGGSLVLGRGHPMAEELRALDLPRRPLLTVIVDHLAFEMAAAHRVS